MTMGTIRLCAVNELSDGQARGFDPLQQGRDTLFVVRRGDRVYAWRDACPHDGISSLAWRRHAYLNAKRDRIVCSGHGALFEIETGLCILGPCLGQALLPVPISVGTDDTVRLDLTALD
jgi:nitrite reductase/ring-hydroxylating ferredoxin subunit